MTFEEYTKQEQERIEYNICLLDKGVRFLDINTAYIDKNAEIGEGTIIYPSVVIEGNTVIGKNCIIGMNTRIVNSEIGDEVDIQNSVITESKIDNGSHVGPFAYLRPGSTIGKNCKVGDFVEVKNSSMGDGAKASHLTYIGDSDVGRNVNLGCGVVFVNYDGSKKYRSIVKDGAFIGCNSNLVSPVEIGEKAYVAAGSTVTSDVPAGALCVAREKQRNIEGWTEKRGILNKDKK